MTIQEKLTAIAAAAAALTTATAAVAAANAALTDATNARDAAVKSLATSAGPDDQVLSEGQGFADIPDKSLYVVVNGSLVKSTLVGFVPLPAPQA